MAKTKKKRKQVTPADMPIVVVCHRMERDTTQRRAWDPNRVSDHLFGARALRLLDMSGPRGRLELGGDWIRFRDELLSEVAGTAFLK